MIYAFTSCALNYVPKARILVESLRRHAPDVCVCLALADKIGDARKELGKDFDLVIGIEDLPELDDPAWIFRHSIVELATAIKPFVLQKLLDRDDCEAVFYFDPDTVLFSRIDEMVSELQGASVLLTPHLTDPEMSRRGIEDNELSALKHGVYNLGYLGVRSTSEGKRFAGWWASRLKDYCYDDIPAGIFTDQRWCDLVPALFEGVKITRNPGYNAAPWNLTNRRIERRRNGSYTVNGVPLVFYHFTGFDSGAHHVMLSLYSKDSPAAAHLFDWYKSELERTGGDALSLTKWAYSSFDNGELITKQQRNVYRVREDLQRAFPNPFSSSNGQDEFTYQRWWRETGAIEYIEDGDSAQRNVGKEDEKNTGRAVIPTKSRTMLSLVWLMLSSGEHRARASALIKGTYHMWGLKGVIALFVRRIFPRV